MGIIIHASSAKLQQRELQENPSYQELVDMGISQEQARRKTKKLLDGDNEGVSRLRKENKKLKETLEKDRDDNTKSNKYYLSKCKGSFCFAEGKTYNKCGGKSHFVVSKLHSKNKAGGEGGRVSERQRE